MARIGNETKLVLKLAKERAEVNARLMPQPYREDEKLREAWFSGCTSGLEIYSTNLDGIISELEGS